MSDDQDLSTPVVGASTPIATTKIADTKPNESMIDEPDANAEINDDPAGSQVDEITASAFAEFLANTNNLNKDILEPKENPQTKDKDKDLNVNFDFFSVNPSKLATPEDDSDKLKKKKDKDKDKKKSSKKDKDKDKKKSKSKKDKDKDKDKDRKNKSKKSSSSSSSSSGAPSDVPSSFQGDEDNSAEEYQVF